ncbi:MAG: hypothetical protein OEZ04_13410, partial [Nitrospinota bacterium]|nr:hypothetical protein [Nitrospinota bacterium]
VPSYDTHAHSNRPASTRQRTLTIEEAYHEAGVGVEINPTTTIIDDSDPAFNTWSVAELHDAMGTHFSRFPGSWPKWHMWGLLAGSFVSSGTGGIMFDARAAYGGAGEAPERQGFAVFRNHSWFNNLKDGAPANQAEAWAMRHFLYTWVHEAGHAFNFLHSWDKSRADSLSWMNYDWKYNSLDSGNDYWRDFEFRFDDEELIHMRHGDRASVIMGGDQWASGGHMDMPADAFSKTMGEAPVELLLRGKGYYEFLSPVSIEVRLRNRLDDMDLELDRRFDPTFGCVKYMIRKPDGKTVLYEPIACQVGDPDLVKLQGAKAAKNGEDRYSQNVYLQYGSGGFYFDVPGDYLVRAIYSGAGEMILTSNTLKLRVGTPLTRREDIVAQDFFSRDVGMCLCLGGSKSRFLTKGMETLEGIMEEFKSTAMQAKIVSMIVGSVGAPFFGIKDPEKLRQIEKLHDGDPKAALAMSKNAMEFYHKEGGGDDNIDYGLLVCQRVRLHKEVGDDKSAKAEGDSLVNDLSSRGVHPPVVKAIQKDMSGK